MRVVLQMHEFTESGEEIDDVTRNGSQVGRRAGAVMGLTLTARRIGVGLSLAAAWLEMAGSGRYLVFSSSF
jgi:hypothetical protein